METEPNQGQQHSLVCLLLPPSLPQWPRSAPFPLLPSCQLSQEGSCCPTQQQCVRRTRRRTSLLLYTNRAGIGTQCCPRQEGGRQTEREGDIREVLRTDCRSAEENRLQQEVGVRPAKHGPTATPPCSRGVSAAPHTSSIFQKLAQMAPLLQPNMRAWFGTGSHCHKLCH